MIGWRDARTASGQSAQPHLRRAGRKAQARAYDAMIAAIAMSRGLRVHTSNAEDFSGISGLEVVEVW